MFCSRFYRVMLCMRGTSHGPVFVSLSVRLFVSATSWSSTKTANRRITQTTPHDSTGTLFFAAKELREIRPGSPPTGAPNAGGWVKIGDFRQITGCISKTVHNRHIVFIKVE